MNVRLYALLAALLLALPFPGLSAQGESKQVVMLLWRGVTDAERGFMDYLSSRMEVEYVLLDANRDKETLQEHLSKVPQLEADLVYTFGTTVTLALLGTVSEPTAFRLEQATPAVFSIVTDPLGSQIISPDNRGGNFTGVTHIVPHDVQLGAIAELPDVESIGVIYNPLENNSLITAKKLKLLSQDSGYIVNMYPLSTSDNKPDISSMNNLVSRMSHDGVQLAYLPPDSYIISNGQQIVDALHQEGIATFSATETPIRKHNALLGIVSRYYNVGQFAGHKAERILTGSQKAADIPAEPLSQYSYIVNVSAAKELDYFPPVSILKISELIGGSDD